MTDPYPTGAGSVRLDAGTETRPDVSGVSVGQLIGEVASDLSTLMRQELELARAEVTAEARKAGKGAGMLGGAGYAGHMFALLVSLALAFGIADLLDFSWGWGLLIVGLIWGAVAYVLYGKGRAQLKTVNAPEQTVESLKEDVQWAKNRTK